jgi:hypothetical protein
MPRYYHHVRIDGDYFPDVAGEEHLDLSAAHVYAMTEVVPVSGTEWRLG